MEENCAPQLIENPSQSGFNCSYKGAPTPRVPQGLAFLACVQLGKPSKLNQNSLLRRGPVTSFAALLLKFQKGHSDNKKYPQLLVKLMSCCCPFRETLISSQRAGARGAQLHSLTALQPPTEPAAELPEEGKLLWSGLLCARDLPAGSPTSHCLGKLSQSRQIPANLVALHQEFTWLLSMTDSLSDLGKERQEKHSNNQSKPKILVSVAYPSKPTTLTCFLELL